MAIGSLPAVSTPPAVPLFTPLRERPGLLLLELAWRWLCGGFLLLLAGYEGWRIWAASVPQLRALGLLNLSPGSALEDPGQALSALSQSGAFLLPQVERATWGLAPLGIFVWVAAFALGRTAVLARFDPRLPRRPWLLAQAEGFRVVGLLGIGAAWSTLAASVLHRLATDAPAFPSLLLLLCVTVAALLFTEPLRRTMQIAAILALVGNRSLLSTWRRAWSFHKTPAAQPIREAVKRVRRLALLLGLVLAFVPSPFPFGPWLLAWWLLLTLPSLAAADAWRLGATFAVLRTMEANAGQRRP